MVVSGRAAVNYARWVPWKCSDGRVKCPPPPAARRQCSYRTATAAWLLFSSTSISARRSIAAQAAQVSAATDAGQALPPEPEQKSVELSTADMKAAVQLARLRAGPGYAIVIAAVEPGSEAAAAGVRPGQQLLQLSDPVRPNEMWVLNENSSLRYVKQAVRMRVPDTITLLLTTQPIPEWRQAVEAARAAASQAAAQQPEAAVQERQQGEPEATSKAALEGGDLLSNFVQAVSSGESFDDAEEGAAAAPGAAEATRQLTVAEKLEAQYRERQQGEGAELVKQQMTALERRQQRRKEYFEQDSKRNDGPFFAAVALLFILPPAVILLVANATGYLDSLDMYAQLR